MKHLFSIILFVFAPLSLFAAPQYSIGWNNPNTTYQVNSGSGTTWLKANETAGLQLSVISTNNLSLSGFTLNYTVKAADGSLSTVSLGSLDSIGQDFALNMVNANDSVEFFIAKDGKRTTMNTWISGLGWDGSSADYVIQDSASPNGTVTIRVKPVAASAPSGQPLPGVVVSLMISGVVGGFYLRRKKAA